MQNIRVAVITGGKVEIKEIAPTLDNLQREVGGFIELVPLGVDLTVYCNEEGKLKGLPATAAWMHPDGHGKVHDILMGPIVIAGPEDEDGAETALPDDWCARIEGVLRIFPV